MGVIFSTISLFFKPMNTKQILVVAGSVLTGLGIYFGFVYKFKDGFTGWQKITTGKKQSPMTLIEAQTLASLINIPKEKPSEEDGKKLKEQIIEIGKKLQKNGYKMVRTGNAIDGYHYIVE